MSADGSPPAVDARLLDALEAAIAAVRGGQSLDRAVSDHPDLAPELRPLLAAAVALTADARPVPPAPDSLRRNRDAFLAAAARARAEAPVSEALDRAIARVLAGEPAVEAVPPELAGVLAPLMVLVQRIRDEVVPAPAAGLSSLRARWLALAASVRQDRAAGNEVEGRALAATAALVAADLVRAPDAPTALAGSRERFMAAAEAARAARSVSPAVQPAVSASRPWWRPSRLLGAPRLRAVASAAAFVLVVIMGNALVLSPVSASALPGDALYPVKRINERLALVFETDPFERDQLRAVFSARRAEELALSVALDDEKTIENWEAVFVDAQRAEDRDPDADLGTFRVLTRGQAGEPITSTLAWDERTSITLIDGTADIVSVSMGSDVRIWARTRGSERLPLALRFKLVALAVPAATPPPSPTPTEEAATQTPDPSPTPVVATQTAVIAPATPTLTLEPSPAPTRTVVSSRGMTPESTVSRLRGILRTDPAQPVWVVRETHSAGAGRLVTVQAARLIEKGVDSALAIGHSVYLEGRWTEEDPVTFVARSLLEHSPDACEAGEAHGTIAAFEPGVALELSGGGRYLFDPESPPVVDGAVEPGVVVDITFEDCGLAPYPFLLTVRVAGGGRPQLVQGVVSEVASDRLVLVQTTGVADPLTVLYDGGTRIMPPGATLAVGQVLAIRGVATEPGVFSATDIEVLQESPTPGAIREGVAPQKPDPEPTSTEEALAESARWTALAVRRVHG